MIKTGGCEIPSVFVDWNIFTVHNEVAKVMFLHLSVCPQGGSASVHAGIPPGSRHPPPTPGRRLLLRTVRTLLECILVSTTNDNCTKVNFVDCQFLASKIAIATTVNRLVRTLNASCKAAEILGAESNPKAMLELETSAVRQSYIKCLN